MWWRICDWLFWLSDLLDARRKRTNKAGEVIDYAHLPIDTPDPQPWMDD